MLLARIVFKKLSFSEIKIFVMPNGYLISKNFNIGNITIGEDSTGTFNMQVEGWSIEGDSTTNILNKAEIVHAGPDDFTSQPSGAAGPRIGCGVIAK